MITKEEYLRAFQSLFYWNAVLKPVPAPAITIWLPVSILVLLECSLKDFCWFCFWWWFSLFQSLFYWNAVLKNLEVTTVTAFGMFQSLFYWNAVLKLYRAKSSQSTGLVSILVLLECSLKVNSIQMERGNIVSFNPCFIGMQS